MYYVPSMSSSMSNEENKPIIMIGFTTIEGFALVFSSNPAD